MIWGTNHGRNKSRREEAGDRKVHPFRASQSLPVKCNDYLPSFQYDTRLLLGSKMMTMKSLYNKQVTQMLQKELRMNSELFIT